MPRLLLSLVLALSTWTMGQDSVNAIVQRSVAANKRDYDAAPQFDCLEQNYKDGGSKTYEEIMVLGSPYERLVAVNGRRLSAAQQADEKRKLDNTISERQKEPPDNERSAWRNMRRTEDGTNLSWASW